jgi:4'-phosphopantetheinyl transferase
VVAEPGVHPFGSAAIEVWILAVQTGEEQRLDRLEWLLDESERATLDRLRRPADRSSQLVAHCALRLLLGAAIGIPPAAGEIERDPCHACGRSHGKPRLSERQAPAFSLSHTDGAAAVAIGEVELGVDVEALRPSLRDLSCVLTEAELATWQRIEAHARDRWVLERWVQKEAYLKGIGSGLTVDPSTVDVDAIMRRPALGRIVEWSIRMLELGDSHVGAVAVRGPHIPLKMNRTNIDHLLSKLARTTGPAAGSDSHC